VACATSSSPNSTSNGDAASSGDDVTAVSPPATDAGPDVTPKGFLDCNLARGDNCWKTTVAAAAGCLPPANESGTLAPDGITCTYASGAVVTFVSPIVFPPILSLQAVVIPSFTVTTGGTQCLRYDTTSPYPMEYRSSITTSAGTVTLQGSATSAYELTCPDDSYYAGYIDGTGLPTCPGDAPGFDFPEIYHQVDASSGQTGGCIGVNLTGAGRPSVTDASTDAAGDASGGLFNLKGELSVISCCSKP
jgi:hypothetical protein